MWQCILVVSVILLDYSSCIDHMDGWNYINLHCRDNENTPVDWWYILKPPGETTPYSVLGYNFSYILPDEPDKWKASDIRLSAESMLQLTLWPMYRSSYRGRLAYMIYDDPHSQEASSHGVLMADEMGGIWIGHSVPGFPHFNRGFPEFPEEEAPNGHLLYCLSVDLVTVNEIAVLLKHIDPEIAALRIPYMMQRFVPAWMHFRNSLRHNVGNPNRANEKLTFDFVTRNETLFGSIQARRPGDSNCLYRDFARRRHIVLDVYGHGGGHKQTLCTEKYSLRTINRISLKMPDYVNYIGRARDHARFAVSTAAHWQRRIEGDTQYWTCVSSLENEDKSGRGGVMFCAHNYKVWLSFDNLKVAEPKC